MVFVICTESAILLIRWFAWARQIFPHSSELRTAWLMSYLLIPVAAKRSRFKTTSLLSLGENIKRSEIAKCFWGHNESPARFFLLHFHQQTAPASHDSAYILHQLRKHPKFFPKEAAWFESHSLINESAFSLSTFAFALTSYFAKHLSRWLLSSASELFLPSGWWGYKPWPLHGT